MSDAGGKRILVCGGRLFGALRTKEGAHRPEAIKEIALFDQAMFRAIKVWGIKELCQGGALGADRLALFWAIAEGIPVMTYPARWKALGGRAGPERNARMLTEWKPDIVLAFPGGKGTADMVKRARAAGVETYLVGWNDGETTGPDDAGGGGDGAPQERLGDPDHDAF